MSEEDAPKPQENAGPPPENENQQHGAEGQPGEGEEGFLDEHDDTNPYLTEQSRNGLPLWVMTFADMMTLLLCFFVLLLSISQIDAIKYKKVTESVEKAFGVQKVVLADKMPAGTADVLKHFSPSTPDVTTPEDLRDKVSKEEADALEKQEAETVTKQKDTISSIMETEVEKKEIQVVEKLIDGRMRVIIRITDQGAFSPASTEIREPFMPSLVKIQKILERYYGKVRIEGHTDNIPINSARFRSNWALSAGRAAAVAEVLLEDGRLKPVRFSVIGLAETQPIASNDDEDTRGQNRRVEIILDQSRTDMVGNKERLEMLQKQYNAAEFVDAHGIDKAKKSDEALLGQDESMDEEEKEAEYLQEESVDDEGGFDNLDEDESFDEEETLDDEDPIVTEDEDGDFIFSRDEKRVREVEVEE